MNITYNIVVSLFVIYVNTCMYYMIIYSFIHYMDLYSASSRFLLRNAPDFIARLKRTVLKLE